MSCLVRTLKPGYGLLLALQGESPDAGPSNDLNTNPMKQKLLIPDCPPTQSGSCVRKSLRLGLLVAAAVSLAANALAQSTATVQTVDKVKSYTGALNGALFSANGGGHTGKTGDYAMDMGTTGTGPVYVAGATWLNDATANDELAVSLWVKKYDIVASSAFWMNSPSSSGTARGFQAHIPWSNDNIYFDTAGCCDESIQRLQTSITSFDNYNAVGDDSYWTNWHFFVFTKKADVKQIWIGGKLFLEGSNTGVLPTDFTDLYIGSAGDGTSIIHGLIDDFCVYGTALAEAEIAKLYAGTLPTALSATDKLLAYWDFNDYPSEGAIASITPAANAKDAVPNLVQIVHTAGSVAWDASNVSLKVDGTAVTPTIKKAGDVETVAYVPSPIFAIQSKHTVSLSYPGIGGTRTLEWTFTVGAYTKDSVASRIGTFLGGSSYTASGGGHTGKAGDLAADFGASGTGPVYVKDAAFLNTIAAKDEMTFALWIKEYSLQASSAFWAQSTSLAERGWQAHVPWSDGTIYFDTAGCCDGSTQRISANISTFGSYSGDSSWWTNWHYMVYQKNLTTKEVWIDGVLFLSGESTSPLPTDFTDLYFGYDPPDDSPMRGVIDDVAIFGTSLDEATIGKLVSGTLPNALPASTKLLAYFDFNDGMTTTVTPTVKIERGTSGLTITFTGTLQSADTIINGSWTDIVGSTSPLTVTPSAGQKYYRAKQ